MSNSLAIAAVTTTLESILLAGITADPDLNDATVTILPPDKARGNANNNQLNLFLYQVTRNAAWSNHDLPAQVKRGETGTPPLALNLYYLITPFGRDNDVTQAFTHQLLGAAMATMHDHPLLSPDEIRAATAATLPRNDLDRQIERVRINFQPLSVEDISKLWTGFATQYRLSAAYEVAVALVESTQPVRAPLPALARGQGDSGVRSQANLTPPFPEIESIEFPNKQSSARLNETILLTGHDLDGANVGVVFQHPLWTAPIEVPVPAGPDATGNQVRVAIPNLPAVWHAGNYSVFVLVQQPGDSYRRQTGTGSLSLAPSMTIAPATSPAGDIVYTVTCSPEVRPEQRAVLLLGGRPEIPADAHLLQTDTLTFTAGAMEPGEYFARLRVDGADSILVNKAVNPPVFDPAQKVTVL